MSELYHYGVLGMRWGIRRYQPYGKGGYLPKSETSFSYSKDDKVFISGKVKYDEPLNPQLIREISKIIKANSDILIGDAPGADTRVQEFLHKNGYKKVTVFTTDDKVRNNVGDWDVKKVEVNRNDDERTQRAQKDILMTKLASKGLAISSLDDRPDSATSKNIQRLINQKSPTLLYDYKLKKWVEK